MARWRVSGQSVARFCGDHGINLSRFYVWRARLNDDAQAAPSHQPASGGRPLASDTGFSSPPLSIASSMPESASPGMVRSAGGFARVQVIDEPVGTAGGPLAGVSNGTVADGGSGLTVAAAAGVTTAATRPAEAPLEVHLAGARVLIYAECAPLALTTILRVLKEGSC